MKAITFREELSVNGRKPILWVVEMLFWALVLLIAVLYLH